MSSGFKASFEKYLHEENRAGSGRASSYLAALQWLSKMLEAAPCGFIDCVDLWAVESVRRLIELRTCVLREQKRHSASPWNLKEIPVSYLRNGYCSAALTQLIEFRAQDRFSQQILAIADAHLIDEAALVEQLNIEPEVPDDFVHDPQSKDGKDRLRSMKERIGQDAFRKLILKTYGGRCCLTGLDLSEINRASHIIGWAERPETRMDPRNGLCLSATYDAAFDRKLITFDEDYRLVLSKTIRERMSTQVLKEYFLSKQGQRLELPSRFQPLQAYLKHHRESGKF